MAAIGAKHAGDRQVQSRIGIPVGNGIVGAAADRGEEIYVPDVTQDERYIADEYPGASEFAVPISYRGEIVGVLDSESDRIDGHDIRQRQLLMAVAVLGRTPCSRATLSLEKGGEIDFSEVIADLAHLPLTDVGDLQPIFASITERAARAIRAQRANIWLFQDDPDELLCIDHFELASHQHSDGVILNRREYPEYFAALEAERVIMANDVYTDPRTAEFAHVYCPENDIRSMLDAPIHQDGQVVGVICIEATENVRHWTKDEANFVATLSDLATIALLSKRKATAESALVHAQKMESLGRLAGGIAHDFNNLLMVIGGAVETLKAKFEGDAGTLRLLDLVSDAGDRAGRLTKNLRAFGGDQPLDMRPTEVNVLFANVQRLIEGVHREDIGIEFSHPPGALWVDGDVGQLEQVLLNLILNAVDAINGVGAIDIRAYREHGDVCIAVSDNGDGMSEETQQRAFDPFFTTKGERGSGLGLSVCQGIVQQHHGTLGCTSTLGKGSQFVLRLPVSVMRKQTRSQYRTSYDSRVAPSRHSFRLAGRRRRRSAQRIGANGACIGL